MPAKRREPHGAPVQLRRYDLPGVTSFRCVRCEQDKSGSFFAIENDDLTRVVCGDCYTAASAAERQGIPVRREPAVASAKVPRQRVPAGRAASGAQSLIDFFDDAGIKVKITEQGRLSVNDVVYQGLWSAQKMPDAWTAGWMREVDAVAWRYAGGKLDTAIRKYAYLDPGLKAVALPMEQGFVIMLGGEAVALIRATRAFLRGGSGIRGNFLTGGSHWARTATAVRTIGSSLKRHELENQLPKPVDSRAEWQRQQETVLQKQREAWGRRQNEKEEHLRIRQAQASKGTASQRTAPPTEKADRGQGAAKRSRVSARSPGAWQLLQFFRTAGISASIDHSGGRLLLNGKETGYFFAREDDLPPGSPAWRDAVDQLTWKHARDALNRAVKKNARLGASARIMAAADDNGFAITQGGEELAVICATRCALPGHGPIFGNFLHGGPHWDQLACDLGNLGAEARPTLAPSPLTSRIDTLPGDLPPALLDACIGASRQIRTQRRIAFERPVVLEGKSGELTVQPITGLPPVLRVPFSFRGRKRPPSDPICGQLLLDPHDPMPVIIAENINKDDAHKAWIAMLLGFADLTCNGPQPTKPHRRRERRRIAPAKFHRRRYRSTGRPPSRRSWAGPVEPVGQWIERGGSYVSAHVRHLSGDQEHSPEARDLAFLVGIILKPHETWVREHVRGVPKGTEIRFRWNAPAEVTGYL
jgi:hypothetical protein